MRDSVKELKEILNHYIKLLKINTNSANAYFDAKKILGRINLDDVINALRQWHESANQEVDMSINDIKALFNSKVNEFINKKQEEGLSTREYGDKWRVGSLEIYLKAENSQIKLSYNKQTIIDYKTVVTPEQINELYSKADMMLKNSLIPIDKRKELFSETYEFLNERNQTKHTVMYPARVSLRDFYNEFKITLIRANQYRVKDLPLWAFLYNLDDYMRPEHNNFLGEKRLILFTGSQRETNTIGMVTNGLNANSDYKIYCYIGRG